MAIRRPRRIFRSSTLPARVPQVGRTVVTGTLGALGVAGLVAAALSTGLFGRPAPGPRTVAAEAGQVAVVDGDTLRLSGEVVRLRGVDAPGRGDLCRGGVDCGGAASTALAGLVRDRRVECRLAGQDTLGRPYGVCDANGTDLSRAIVASGWARARAGEPGLADLELRARRQRSGLWADAAAL